MSILKIEQNTFGHFQYLPKLLKFSVKQFSNITIVNCGLGSSTFNIVCDANLNEDNLDREIDKIINEFKNQPFAWWIGSSSKPDNLSKFLLTRGFEIESTEHAMICDFKNFGVARTKKLNIEIVEDINKMNDFISIISPYDKSAEYFYKKLKSPSLSKKEKLFVGYVDGRPITTGTLYIDFDTVGIFNLITLEEERKKGYGTDMMCFLIDYAKKAGISYASLSASSDSGFRIYKRLGFNVRGKFECLEWKGM
ncbi:MAG: GNAT family N-acetyltransferase [Alphaproteobacteria bacterium]